MFMSAWRDNERVVALTRHARQEEKRGLDPDSPRLEVVMYTYTANIKKEGAICIDSHGIIPFDGI